MISKEFFNSTTSIAAAKSCSVQEQNKCTTSSVIDMSDLTQQMQSYHGLSHKAITAPLKSEQRVTKSSISSRRRTSRYLGVGSSNRKNQWQARIIIKGKVTHLGYYGSEEEAARIYDRVCLSLNGTSATLNFPVASYKNFPDLNNVSREDLQRSLGVKPMDKSSRFRGVSKKKGKWEAKVMLNRRWAYRELFDSEEDAARAYDKAVMRLKPNEARAYINFKDDHQGLGKNANDSILAQDHKTLARARALPESFSTKGCARNWKRNEESCEVKSFSIPSRFPEETLGLTSTDSLAKSTESTGQKSSQSVSELCHDSGCYSSLIQKDNVTMVDIGSSSPSACRIELPRPLNLLASEDQLEGNLCMESKGRGICKPQNDTFLHAGPLPNTNSEAWMHHIQKKLTITTGLGRHSSLPIHATGKLVNMQDEDILGSVESVSSKLEKCNSLVAQEVLITRTMSADARMSRTTDTPFASPAIQSALICESARSATSRSSSFTIGVGTQHLRKSIATRGQDSEFLSRKGLISLLSLRNNTDFLSSHNAEASWNVVSGCPLLTEMPLSSKID